MTTTATDARLEAATAAHRAQAGFEAEVAGVAGVVNAADARLVELVVRALGEGLWSGDRIHTPTQWLMLRAGLSRVRARRVLLLARRAAELPVTMAAFTEGRLSADQAATVARYAPAEFEASVCSVAVHATVAQIAKATRTYAFDAEANPADAPEKKDDEPDLGEKDPETDRSVAFGTDEDGSWFARMRLPVDEGLAVEGALKAARDRLHAEARKAAKARAVEEGRSPKDVKVPVPSWADAAVGLAHSILNGGAGRAEMAIRSRILMHLETPDGPRSDRWMGSLHLGGVLPDELRRYLTCDGDVEVVWEKGGTPVSLGRTKHIVPRRIRRIIEHRDHGCRVPGCDQHHWLQIHHMRHWEDGGPTDTWNLICLCSTHHRAHHKGLLGITGNADIDGGVTFSDRHGRPIGATAACPPQAGDMPDVPAYQGPTGERLQAKWVTFQRDPHPDGHPTDDRDDGADPDDLDPGPPGRRRHHRCRTPGRRDTGPPDGSRAPPRD